MVDRGAISKLKMNVQNEAILNYYYCGFLYFLYYRNYQH
jgi:hypothetical protein